MSNTVVNVNKREYHAGDVIFTVFGREEDRIKSISYDYSRVHNYNKSLKGITSWSMGGIDELTCNIELYETAIRQIEAEARQNGVNDITLIKPFPIAVTYSNDELATVTDIITCKFKKHGKSVEGEEGLAMQYEMFVTKLEINV